MGPLPQAHGRPSDFGDLCTGWSSTEQRGSRIGEVSAQDAVVEDCVEKNKTPQNSFESRDAR